MSQPALRPPAGPAVEIRGLEVWRGGAHVLHGFDLTLAAGTVTGLIGPSGCGKTTLMRSIAGVQRVRSGDVRVLGAPAGSPPLRHEVGYLTQAPSVYADLRVDENLRYFAGLLGAPSGDVEDALRIVGAKGFRHRLVGRLSGGQRARVSLASALLGSPRLLVLDEPTVGVDPVLRNDIWTTFRELAARGTTLLVSSHVMDEAERCDAVILMREGRVLAAGEPAELRRRAGAQSMDEAFLRLVEADR